MLEEILLISAKQQERNWINAKRNESRDSVPVNSAK